MNVFADYEKMEKKVLIVGQETHSWEKMNFKLTLQELQRIYENFNLGKPVGERNGKRLRCLTSPFWNFSRTFFHNVNKENTEVSRKTNGFLWTNISKFECNSITPDQELQKRNAAGFRLLKTEISILKLGIVVFLTGTKYDGWIDKVLSPQREIIISDVFLTKFTTVDGSLPSLTFQTKHPVTLQRSKNSENKGWYHVVLGKMTELALL